jgi:hypothetical protein
MKCKHSEIWSRWVTKHGLSISSGSNEIKREYTCVICGKTFVRKPTNCK